MNQTRIVESGMTFGPYPEGRCFYIEKSHCYQQIQEGVQMAEFLLLRQQQQGETLWIVEAKTTCPRQLDTYIEEIRTKFLNGWMLGMAACIGRHSVASQELPPSFQQLDFRTTDIRFVLVVKKVPDFHLPELQNALYKALKPVIKTWALPPTSVMVLNEATAQKHGVVFVQ